MQSVKIISFFIMVRFSTISLMLKTTNNFSAKESKLKSLIAVLVTVACGLAITGCTPSVSQMKKLIEDNPEILFGAIEKNPTKFLEVLDSAVKKAREAKQQEMVMAEEKKRDEEFKNPKKPDLNDKVAVLGDRNAPIVIVEYSDFECPFCAKGYRTVMKVKEAYGDKVAFVYKHLPLDFHPKARPAAEYYEAIALQDTIKAYKFHDVVFENQDKLRSDGNKYLDKVAKSLGVNLGKLKKDLKSDAVKSRIDADIAEARKFGFSGTPGFLINGVSLKGAYPFEDFKKIIDKHLKPKGG